MDVSEDLNTVYITDYDNDMNLGYLRILNTSNLAAPKLIGQLQMTDEYTAPMAIQVKGNYAYMVDFDDGFYIVNVQNVRTPSIVGNLSYTGWGNLYDVVLTPNPSIALVAMVNAQ